MGPSGSGKGTQAARLKTHLEKHSPQNEVLSVAVGKHFRDIASEHSYTHRALRAYIENGKLAPEFLVVWAWGDVLANRFAGNEHLVFDGTPRRLREAHMLHEALQFYGRDEVAVVVLNLSKECSRERLAARGRADDIDHENVERRLRWYDTEVMPVLDFFRENALYTVIDVDGARTAEEVHQSIIGELFP